MMSSKISASLLALAVLFFTQQSQAQSAHPNPFIAKVTSLPVYSGATSPSNAIAGRSIVSIYLGSGGAVGFRAEDTGDKGRTGIDAVFTQGNISARMCDEPMWLLANTGPLADGSGVLVGVMPLTAETLKSCKLVVQAWFEDGSTTPSQPVTVEIAPHSDQPIMFLDGNFLIPYILDSSNTPMTRLNPLPAGSTATILGTGCGPAVGLQEYLNDPVTGFATDKPAISINGLSVQVLQAGFYTSFPGECAYTIKLPSSIHGTASMMLGNGGPYTMFIK